MSIFSEEVLQRMSNNFSVADKFHSDSVMIHVALRYIAVTKDHYNVPTQNAIHHYQSSVMADLFEVCVEDAFLCFCQRF